MYECPAYRIEILGGFISFNYAVCSNIYIYIFIHIHTYIYIYVYTPTHLHTYINTYIHKAHVPACNVHAVYLSCRPHVSELPLAGEAPW